MEHESDEELYGAEEKSQNMFLDAEADDSEKESDDENSFQIKLCRKSKSNSENFSNQMQNEMSSEISKEARSCLSLDLKVKINCIKKIFTPTILYVYICIP